MKFVGGIDVLALVAMSLALDLAILAMSEVIRVGRMKKVRIWGYRQAILLRGVLITVLKKNYCYKYSIYG